MCSFCRCSSSGRIAEAVGEMLLEDRLVRQRPHLGMDLHAARLRQEEGGSRAERDVLDVHQRQPVRAEVLQQAAGLPDGGRAALQRISAAGEVVVLQVDQEQGGVHHSIRWG